MITGSKQREKTRQQISAAMQGENHWHAKLTEDQVRWVFSQKGKKQALVVVTDLGGFVDRSTIYAIWSGKNWNHVTGAKPCK